MIPKTHSNHMLRALLACVVTFAIMSGFFANVAIAAPAGTMTATPMIIRGTQTKTTNPITITDSGGEINTSGWLAIRVPDVAGVQWDNTVNSVGISVTGTGAVSTTPNMYYKTTSTTNSGPNDTVLLQVTTNFTSGSSVTITGLRVITTGASTTAATPFLWSVDGPPPGETWGSGAATLEIDATAPTPTVTTSVNPIYSGALTQTVTVTYDEAMDPTTSPVISMGGGNWGAQADAGLPAAWSAGDTVYTATFTHNGTAEYIAAELATILAGSGATDVAGNAENGDTSPTFVVDTQSPTVTAGNLTADESACTGAGGECIIGDTITFTWDNTGGGDNNTDEDPTTVLADITNFGGGAAQLLYDDGTNGDAGADDIYTYDYTVVADNDTGTLSFDLNVDDLSGNTTGPVTSTDTAPIDNVRPTPTVTTSIDPIYEGSLTQTVTVTYDEAMDPTTSPVISMGGGNWGAQADAGLPAAWSAGDTVYTATFTHNGTQENIPAELATILAASGATDAAGNAENGDTSPTFVVDTQKPTPTVTTSVDPIYSGALTQTVTVTYDEAMDPTTSPVISMGGGNWGAQTDAGLPAAWSAGDTVYTATFTHNGTAEYIAAELATILAGSGATDVAGNAENGDTSPTFVVDTQSPTVTAGNLIADEALCTGAGGECIIGDTINFVWRNDLDGNTDEDPTTVLADITNFGGGAAQLLYDDGTNGDGGPDDIYTYAFTVGAGTNDGTFSFDLNVDDLLGNTTGPVTSTDTAPIDNIQPTPTVTTSVNPIYEGALTQTVIVTYDEAMDPTTSPVISMGGGNWGAQADAGLPAAWSAGDTVYTATFTHNGTQEYIAAELATILAGSGATDAAGNAENGDTSPTFVVDTQKPTPTVTTSVDPIYSGALTQTVTVTYDEAMDPTTSPVISMGGGNWGAQADAGLPAAWSAGDTVYTATFTHNGTQEYIAAELATILAASGATDAAGNAENGDTSPTFVVDTQGPTVTPGNLTADESACTGTGGTCIVGDTITFTWDNTGGGDNNTDEDPTAVLADLTNFGGGAAQLLYDDGTNGDAGADDIYTYDYTVLADNDTGILSFDLNVDDLSANTTGPVTSTDTAPIDNVLPTVTGYTLSDALIDDSDVGVGTFYVDVDYSETMDGTSTPSMVFTPNLFVSGTLVANGGASSWQDADTYRAAFDVVDVNETVNVTDIAVASGDDANGNTQPLYNSGAPTGLSVDTQNLTLSAGNLTADESACTGLGGACIIGDTITFTWDNSGGGDNNADEDSTTVLADLTNFGGGAAQLLYDDGATGGDPAADDIYTFDLTVVADDDDATNTFDLAVSDLSGNPAGPVTSIDTAPVDNIAPSITTPGSFTIAPDVNANSVANVGDSVTYNAATLAAADGDTITVDVTTLTGTVNLAPGVPDPVILGTVTGATQFTETVTDDAGNIVAGNTTALNCDNRSPLTNTSVTLSNTDVNNTTTVFTIAFTTTNAWPADGDMIIDFPAEFNIAAMHNDTAANLVNVDGVLTATVAGQTATITRDGSGVAVPGSTAVSFDIARGINGPTAGTTGTFNFETRDNTTTIIDVDSSVLGVTLTAVVAPPPSSGGGGGGGHRTQIPSLITTTSVLEEIAFTDTEGHWGETYIDEAKDSGYVEGYEDNTFKPDQNITRAEASKLIALWFNMNIGDDVCDPADFDDVNCDADWFGKYVSYLFDKEVIEGYSNGDFGPGNNITRAEALKMLIFAKMLQEYAYTAENPFLDVMPEDWFFNWVMIGYELMIVEGYGDGNFAPHNSITRAEFTKIFIETLLNN